MTFTLPKLSFETNALEPFMDQQTLEIHHGKHHAGYIQKLHGIMETEGLSQLDLEKEVFPQTEIFPKGLIINAGQHWNHDFFWKSLAPTGQTPSAAVLERIVDSFGSYETFVEEFTNHATTVFGSGWTWLCEREDKSLAIVNTHNHENPLMDNIVKEYGKVNPLMVIDVWEHAYYLKYQNRRPEFIAAFLQIINWEHVEERMS